MASNGVNNNENAKTEHRCAADFRAHAASLILRSHDQTDQCPVVNAYKAIRPFVVASACTASPNAPRRYSASANDIPAIVPASHRPPCSAPNSTDEMRNDRHEKNPSGRF